MVRSLSVVIPAYNEEKRIGKTLERVYNYLLLNNYDFEIIVSNDGSTDKTMDVIRSFKGVSYVSNPKNEGKGRAVFLGVAASVKKWILVMDSDMSVPIEELDLFFSVGGEVVIGSRRMEGSRIMVPQPWYRELSGYLFSYCVNMLAIPKIHDTQCGMKLFRRDAAGVFHRQLIKGFGFDVETIYLLKKYGYNVKEIPISWYNDKNSKVSLFKHALPMFFDIIKIRWNDMRGRYEKI